jgi:hypothetical protein
MDILTLDIVGVIVVLTVEIIAEILMLKGVCVSQVTMSSWFELVELVSCVWGIAYESGQLKGHQNDWG